MHPRGGGIVKRPIQVSDHAVLRYLERVGGFNIEALRKAMARRIERPAELGVHAVNVEGYRFVVKSHPDRVVVVTVLDKDHLGTQVEGEA